MKTLTIRGVELGAGRTKLAVSLAASTPEELAAQATALRALPLDLVEWRADSFSGLGDEPALRDTLRALRGALGDIPLLFTIRTARQGGAAALPPERYAELTLAAARSGCADLVDVELSGDEVMVRELLRGVHGAGCPVVGSRHDFSVTPPREAMLAFLCEAQELGADVPKLAVTPQSDADVLALLAVSAEFREKRADRPFITVSMGARGVVSRVACALSGSCLTFACADAPTAPGQLPAAELRRILSALDYE